LALPIGGLNLTRVGDGARAAAATTGDGLDHHRAAGSQRREERPRLLERNGVVQPSQDGHAGGRAGGARAGLVAEQLEVLDARAHERDPGLGAAAGEVGALGQETVAGMDRLAAGRPRRGDDRVDIEVGARAASREPVCLVRHPDMEALGVVVRVNGDGAQAEVGPGAGDANRDLSAVGD
jgi:hypothetical protein